MIERRILGMCRRRFWLPVLIVFLLWFLLLYFFFYSSTILGHLKQKKHPSDENNSDHRELIDSADFRGNSHETRDFNKKKTVLLSKNNTKNNYETRDFNKKTILLSKNNTRNSHETRDSNKKKMIRLSRNNTRNPLESRNFNKTKKILLLRNNTRNNTKNPLESRDFNKTKNIPLPRNNTKSKRDEADNKHSDVFEWKYFPDYINDILEHEEEIEGEIIAKLRKAEVKPVVQKPEPERREEPKPERREEPIPERREEPKPERREEPIPERREEPIPERREEPKPERREELIPKKGEEHKTERREEPISKRQEEPKLERREERKPKRREESKPEKREEPLPKRMEEPKPKRREEPIPKRREETIPKRREEPRHRRNHKIQRVTRQPETIHKPATKYSGPKACKNRYIHIYRIPRRFNEDLLTRCRSLSQWTDMCPYIGNMGLGPQLNNVDKVYSNAGWFATNQFMLEVIFHNRMKQYDCLTNDPAMAAAIYVPYYPGLDVARFLWWKNEMDLKDVESLELVKWLRHKPEWKRMWGRDHFFVAGRITWDFRRYSDDKSDWGSQLLLLPEIKNMTALVIESSPWNNNDFAIPYPTYFHPSSDFEVFQWQDRIREPRRNFLFSFAGGTRPSMRDSIREQIIYQCRRSKRCKLLQCVESTDKCYKPDNVMKMFRDSVFCLQPPGDSMTRRSTFDSILSGCIPVFFHPGSAYVQYIWHLPRNYTKYSIFIPANKVKKGKVNIENILGRIPIQTVNAMREEVIKLIPKVIYADPTARLQTLEDAFDVTIKGVLDRVKRIRKEMKEGKKMLSTDLVEKIAWKYNLFGTVEDHEWDHFFYGPYERT